jgi:hypothetical protein
MWFSLRSGLANMAAIAALALLPLVSFASAMLRNGPEQARVESAPISVEQVVWQAEPLLAHFDE